MRKAGRGWKCSSFDAGFERGWKYDSYDAGFDGSRESLDARFEVCRKSGRNAFVPTGPDDSENSVLGVDDGFYGDWGAEPTSQRGFDAG